MDRQMTVAMISEVYFGEDWQRRLERRLGEACELGADLALLPELPVNPWSPAHRNMHDHDAEAPGGPRHQGMAAAARHAGIALVGGAILTDAETGLRYNTALVYSSAGDLLSSYRKVHLPEEEGFWETSHYHPGDRPAPCIDSLSLPIGLQICSDINRPEGCQILAAAGVAAILTPRATERSTYERWRLMFRANAMTSGCYLLSVNRPVPEQGVGLGGPSIAVDPNGEVIAEGEGTITVVRLRGAEVARARQRYPGYLPYYPSLYADGWQALADPG